MGRRALHFVFKVGNRTKTAEFYRDILGMKFLRHEEFEEGCKASCNGPYDGKWSKSMVGYGSEDTHFVVELTYNYGVAKYRLGNDFLGLTIYSKSVLQNAKKHGLEIVKEDHHSILTSPDGYKFKIFDEESDGDSVKKVTLASSDLNRSINYWSQLCGMTVLTQSDQSAELAYEKHQCHLELYCVRQTIDHGSAFGRIAFSCPENELPAIEKQMHDAGERIITPFVRLETPGKATVAVVILADPDGHEICFVGDEGFRELSATDVKADQLLDEAISHDKSDEWFAKKGRSKETR